MNIFEIVLIAIVFIAQMALIYPFVKSMIPQKTNKSLAIKMICSTSFLAIGILAKLLSNSSGIYSLLIVAALCLAWVGDLLLGLNGSKIYFIIGGVFFLLTHFCYITAFTYSCQKDLSPGHAIGVFEIVFSLVLLALFEIYNKKKKISLGKLHMPVLIYGLILTIMLSKAIIFSQSLFSQKQPFAALIILFGAILFFVSDFTLTYTILEEKRKQDVRYKFINSLSYFLGQSLIAFSIILIK